MEEFLEILPWMMGGGVVGVIGGAAVGAKYGGSAGAVTGVFFGPFVVYGVLIAGALGVNSADRFADRFRTHKKWSMKCQHCRDLLKERKA
jgi:hypothetical protein